MRGPILEQRMRRSRHRLDQAGGDKFASALVLAMMRLNRRVRSDAEAATTIGELSALRTLAERGPLSPTTLAGIERVRPPSMTRIIGRLEQRGLAVRVAHATDRRQSILHLTAQGQAALEHHSVPADAILAGSISRLSLEEQELLQAALPLLERLAEA